MTRLARVEVHPAHQVQQRRCHGQHGLVAQPGLGGGTQPTNAEASRYLGNRSQDLCPAATLSERLQSKSLRSLDQTLDEVGSEARLERPVLIDGDIVVP